MTIYWKIFLAIQWIWMLYVGYHAFLKQGKAAQPTEEETKK